VWFWGSDFSAALHDEDPVTRVHQWGDVGTKVLVVAEADTLDVEVVALLFAVAYLRYGKIEGVECAMTFALLSLPAFDDWPD